MEGNANVSERKTREQFRDDALVTSSESRNLDPVQEINPQLSSINVIDDLKMREK